jgi:hypothetical protein
MQVPVCRRFGSLARRQHCYDLIRAMEDRARSALARIASVLALRKSRNVCNTTEGLRNRHATIRSRYRSGTSRTNCMPFDRRLLVEAGTMATPSSASTNDRIVCIEFGYQDVVDIGADASERTHPIWEATGDLRAISFWSDLSHCLTRLNR